MELFSDALALADHEDTPKGRGGVAPENPERKTSHSPCARVPLQ
jgi:hypothetical protein